jgi:peptidoglycan hydrolase-like amidase
VQKQALHLPIGESWQLIQALFELLKLEAYLASVIGNQMSAAALLEALKVQVIAARSYEERAYIPPCKLFIWLR